ncbi:hypothetical protein LCGC14_0909510 [marine sediment metagenome]|uniref:Uncharacterized protein n=1 Tax=marine sediment metagenome TaxID=412755 RepID=A0A0F9NU15_9ZZZZ
MVDRTKAEMIESFDGLCEKVEIVPDQMRDSGEQIHMEFKPDDEEILKGSKTGRFHEWLRLTDKTTETTVPEGSKIEAYLKEIEVVLPETKKTKKVVEAFMLMQGKKFTFVRKTLGKAFKGHEAKPSFIPQTLLD